MHTNSVIRYGVSSGVVRHRTDSVCFLLYRHRVANSTNGSRFSSTSCAITGKAVALLQDLLSQIMGHLRIEIGCDELLARFNVGLSYDIELVGEFLSSLK